MSKYIDAEWLTGELRTLPLRCGRMVINEIINHAPSIDITRCSECKYFEPKEDWCYWKDESITADGFCSYGERSSE